MLKEDNITITENLIASTGVKEYVITHQADGFNHEQLEVFFSKALLQQKGWYIGEPNAGRGNAYFFNYLQEALLCRHYYRGGLIARLCKDRYWWRGLYKTRAYQEFLLLQQMYADGLPVPKVFIARVLSRATVLYSRSYYSLFTRCTISS